MSDNQTSKAVDYFLSSVHQSVPLGNAEWTKKRATAIVEKYKRMEQALQIAESNMVNREGTYDSVLPSQIVSQALSFDPLADA
jgi:hypothetical protein